MVRMMLTALTAVLFLCLPAQAQTGTGSEPPTPPAEPPPTAAPLRPAEDPAVPPSTQPAPLRTITEVLDAVEQALLTAQRYEEDGNLTETRKIRSEALAAIQMILRNDERNIRARVIAGEIALQTGAFNEAREHFQVVLANESGNFRANFGMGKYYAVSHLWRNAEKYLSGAERTVPSDRRAELLQTLAYVYINQDNKSKAVETAERAVAVDAENLASLRLLVQARVQADQVERAVEAAQQLVSTAVRQHEAQPASRAALQRVLEAYNVLIEALKAYHNTFYRKDAQGRVTEEPLPGKARDAARVLVEVARISAELARRHQEMNQHEALMLVERAVQYDPNNSGYLLELAALLEATRQRQRQIETYQKILQIEAPTHPDAARHKELARQALETLGAAPAPPAGPTGPPADAPAPHGAAPASPPGR